MLTPRGDRETDDDSSYGDEGGLVGDVLASEGGGDVSEREEDRAAEGGIWGATILRGSDEMSDGRNRDETEERLTFEDRGGWAVVSEDEGAFGRSSELRRQDTPAESCDEDGDDSDHDAVSSLSGEEGSHDGRGGGGLSLPSSLPSDLGSVTVETPASDPLLSATRAGAVVTVDPKARRRSVLLLAAVASLLTGAASYLVYERGSWRGQAMRLEEELRELRRAREEAEAALAAERRRAKEEEEAAAKSAREEADRGKDGGGVNFEDIFGTNREGDAGRTFAVDNCWFKAETKVSLGQCSADSVDRASRVVRDVGRGASRFLEGIRDAARSSWSPGTAAGAAAAAATRALQRVGGEGNASGAPPPERDRSGVLDATADSAARLAEDAARAAKNAARTAAAAAERLYDDLAEAAAGTIRSADVVAGALKSAEASAEGGLRDAFDAARDAMEEHTTTFSKHVGRMGAGEGRWEDRLRDTSASLRKAAESSAGMVASVLAVALSESADAGPNTISPRDGGKAGDAPGEESAPEAARPKAEQRATDMGKTMELLQRALYL